MKGILAAGAAALLAATSIASAQQAQQPPRPYYTGNLGVGLPVAPPAPTAEIPNPPNNFAAATSNVRMFGALFATESCIYDESRGVVVAPNRGVGQAIRANDAWISLINHDGTVNTPRWIGIQNPGAQRDNMTPPLVLNEPFGSFILNGVLYLADRDGGTPDPAAAGTNIPSVAVVRMFDMATGAPAGSWTVPGSTGLNDIAVAPDGTIYGTNSGVGGANPDPTTWVIWKVTPGGEASIFAQGEPMRQPNGIEVGPDGNIVVVNIGKPDVITYSPDGQVVMTEMAAQTGNDGLVIMPNGVKFVSSVQLGGVSMIKPGEPATLIAENVPSAASMCYDKGANQLVIPLNANNGLAFISLEGIYTP